MGLFNRGIILILMTLAILAVAALVYFRFELTYLKNRDLVDRSAAKYGLPPLLLASLIWQESHFQELKRGKAGEIGLVQILPASAREWEKAEGIESFCSADLFNPVTNTLAGSWYLGRAMNRWKSKSNPIPYALAEYNAGPSNAQRWDRSATDRSIDFTDAITYPATRRYVKSIMARHEHFGRPWRYQRR